MSTQISRGNSQIAKKQQEELQKELEEEDTLNKSNKRIQWLFYYQLVINILQV